MYCSEKIENPNSMYFSFGKTFIIILITMNFDLCATYDRNVTLEEIKESSKWKKIIENKTEESNHLVYMVRIYVRKQGKFYYKVGYTENKPNGNFKRLSSLNTEYDACGGHLSTNIILLFLVKVSGQGDESNIKKFLSTHFTTIPHRRKNDSVWTELGDVSPTFYDKFEEYVRTTYGKKNVWESNKYEIDDSTIEHFGDEELSQDNPEEYEQESESEEEDDDPSSDYDPDESEDDDC